MAEARSCCAQMEEDTEAVLEDWTQRHIAGLIALAAPW